MAVLNCSPVLFIDHIDLLWGEHSKQANKGSCVGLREEDSELAHNREPNAFRMAGKSRISKYLLLTSPETWPSGHPASGSSSCLFLPLPGDGEGDGPPSLHLERGVEASILHGVRVMFLLSSQLESALSLACFGCVRYGTFSFLEHLNVMAEGAPAVPYSEIGQDRCDRGKVGVNLHWSFPPRLSVHGYHNISLDLK